MRTLLSVLLVGILLMASSVVLSAEPTVNDVHQALVALVPAHADEIMSAFSLGLPPQTAKAGINYQTDKYLFTVQPTLQRVFTEKPTP